MVATVFNMPYRVLRCAQASLAEVYVLGNPGASWLRFSRYCRRFASSACIIHGGRDEAWRLKSTAWCGNSTSLWSCRETRHQPAPSLPAGT